MDNLGSASRLAPRLNRNFSLYHQIEAILLEQIVTDGGAQTAMQIEALRESKRIENGEKVR